MPKHLLFIDTETTGPKPLTARLCEVAFILALADAGSLTKLEEGSKLIYPDQLDQYPNPQVTAIHGITGDEMLEQGMHLPDALEWLSQPALTAAREARSFPLMVAHNISYDNTVLVAEHRRCGREYKPFDLFLPFCTMKALTERCRLPSRYPGQYKWPSLKEAWEFCFDRSWPESEENKSHRALFDTQRCFEIYQHGLEEGWWSCD